MQGIDTGYKPKITLAKNNRSIRMDGDEFIAVECPKEINPCSLCDIAESSCRGGDEIEYYCSAEYYSGWDDEDMNLCRNGEDNDGIPYYFLLDTTAHESNRLNIDESQLAKECHEFCMFHQEGCYNGPNCLLRILERYHNRE